MDLSAVPKLVGVDLETTGCSWSDHIVEIAVVTFIHGERKRVYCERVNPGIPIPPKTTEIHGITDQDVRDKPRFADLADDILDQVLDAVWFGYNVIFDFNVLCNELIRAGKPPLDRRKTILIDPFSIWKKQDPKTLSHAYRFFCGKDLENAHNALADVDATFAVLTAQFTQYPDLPADVYQLGAYCYPKDPSWVLTTYHFIWDEQGDILCNFGKVKGTPLKKLARDQRSFLEWVLKGNFPQDVKMLVGKALDGDPLPEKVDENSTV